jgi:hypothetical protein
MNQALRRLLSPPRVWPLATLLALGIIAAATVFCPVADSPNAVNNPLVYANGESVPDGRWSVLCVDGVAYLEIAFPQGHTVVPKYRKNGLVARCELPAGE